MIIYGSSLVIYGAGISACSKGGQWQRALALFKEMRNSKLNPDIISCNAGISACGKGEQWQRALALLSEMWEAKLEPTAICTAVLAPAQPSGRRRPGCPKNPSSHARHLAV